MDLQVATSNWQRESSVRQPVVIKKEKEMEIENKERKTGKRKITLWIVLVEGQCRGESQRREKGRKRRKDEKVKDTWVCWTAYSLFFSFSAFIFFKLFLGMGVQLYACTHCTPVNPPLNVISGYFTELDILTILQIGIYIIQDKTPNKHTTPILFIFIIAYTIILLYYYLCEVCYNLCFCSTMFL